jgi:hypothetical protein
LISLLSFEKDLRSTPKGRGFFAKAQSANDTICERARSAEIEAGRMGDGRPEEDEGWNPSLRMQRKSNNQDDSTERSFFAFAIHIWLAGRFPARKCSMKRSKLDGDN